MFKGRTSTVVMSLAVAAGLVAAGCSGTDQGPGSKASSAPRTPQASGSPGATTPDQTPMKLTRASLRSAPVPALCGHRAGSLVAGELPGIPSSQGFVRLRTDLITLGDLTGDGVEEALAVLECGAGGVGLPHQLVAFEATPSGPATLSAFNTWGMTRARDGVMQLRYRNRAVVVSSRAGLSGDPACCPSGRIQFAVRLDGNRLTATRTTPEPSVTASGNVGPLTVGQTAHFSYFDVTVDDHREDGAVWGAHVRVCYTRAHPSANPDGTTRVSTNPWQFGSAQQDGGVDYSASPTIDAEITDYWRPAYAETLLRVGQCHAGWVSVSLVEAVTGFSGMRYAPNDFDFSATWGW